MLRAVIVGCGAMSRACLEAAAQIDDLAIVGLVDIDPTRAEARAAEFGLRDAATGDDLGAMLQRTRPDMVFDIVVPAARYQVALTAFAHGCHLLSEKPMADTLDHARDLIRAARAAGRIHAVVQNRRYIPGVRRIRRFLDGGAIGHLTTLHCDFFLGPHFGGFREEMQHVLLLDMAIHTFDAARLLCDGSPVAVYCKEWNPPNSWYAHGASAVAIFEMANGVVFTYRGSWCAEGLRTSWESTWRALGAHGTLIWDGEDGLAAEAVIKPGGLFAETAPVEIPPLDPRDRVGGHLGVMQDFVESVRTGIAPETAGHENIKSLAMVFGAIESARTGGRIELRPEGMNP